MLDKCLGCKKRFERHHLNQKYCIECKKLRREKNCYIPPCVTKKHIEFIKKNHNNMSKKEISIKLGISVMSIKRTANVLRIKFQQKKYNDQIVKEVVDYYNRHGMAATKNRYKNICVRSIIDRNNQGVCPFQRNWLFSEIIEAIRMGGIISLEDQWKYFKRPGAFKGSIQSLWIKRLHGNASVINGLYRDKALCIVKRDTPSLSVKHRNAHLYLWIDIEKNLLPNMPDSIQLAVKACADFQRWIFGVKDVKRKIRKMIKERSNDC
jgi:hypothetical protein